MFVCIIQILQEHPYTPAKDAYLHILLERQYCVVADICMRESNVPQKSTNDRHRAQLSLIYTSSKEPNTCLEKRPVYTQKSPMHPHKKPIQKIISEPIPLIYAHTYTHTYTHILIHGTCGLDHERNAQRQIHTYMERTAQIINNRGAGPSFSCTHTRTHIHTRIIITHTHTQGT